MFNQGYKTLKLKAGGTRLKGGGAPWYHPLGETLIYIYIYMYNKLSMNNNYNRVDNMDN